MKSQFPPDISERIERTGVIEEHLTEAWQRRIAYAFRFPNPAKRKNR